MITGRIEVHSHLLPGVDDGSESLTESMECAEMLVDAGYTHCFCTPHIWPSLPDVTVASVTEWTAELQAELDASGIPLKLLPGGEINLRTDTQYTKPEALVTYGMNRKYVLIDLWADRLPVFFRPAVKWMHSLDITVVLAHPQRMRAVQDQPSLADTFAELGVLLQGNLQCLVDEPEAMTRRTMERFLTEDRYFMLGSDLHKTATLGSRLAGLERAIELMGTTKIDKLTITNPAKLLP